MLNYLQDNKPAIRFIALNRISTIQHFDESIINSLKKISMYDKYVKIVKRPCKMLNDRPSPPGLGETDIEFPLRVFARKLLLQQGHYIEYNSDNEAKEGIIYFAEHWKNNPKRRDNIQDAIGLLGINSLGRKVIKQLAQNEDCELVYKIFMNQITK